MGSFDDVITRVRDLVTRARVEAGRRIAYHGAGRLVAVATGSVVLVVAGWWLLRPPAAPIEAVIPRATVSASSIEGPGRVDAAPRIRVASGGTVRVHVAGAVRRPGVYALPADARIVDAVAAAGGATTTADLDRINLAQSLVDAEQVFVPRRGTTRTATSVAPRHRPRRTSTSTTFAPPGASDQTAPSPAGTSSSPAVVPKVNLNTATAAQLESLTGVGPATARAIVSYRSRRGPFAKIEDLLNIDGIGPKKLESLRDQVEL